jgi:hypothetical protein
MASILETAIPQNVEPRLFGSDSSDLWIFSTTLGTHNLILIDALDSMISRIPGSHMWTLVAWWPLKNSISATDVRMTFLSDDSLDSLFKRKSNDAKPFSKQQKAVE